MGVVSGEKDTSMSRVHMRKILGTSGDITTQTKILTHLFDKKDDTKVDVFISWLKQAFKDTPVTNIGAQARQKRMNVMTQFNIFLNGRNRKMNYIFMSCSPS